MLGISVDMPEGEREMSTFQGNVSGAGYGYVYVMSYPGSDKVKIGHALNPTSRAADIGGTLAPETPIAEAYFWCSERREDVERKAHAIVSANRCNGEWFKISVQRAVEVIQQAASAVGVSIQLVHDRNEWEAKAAAKLAENLARIPNMSDIELNAEFDKLPTGAFENVIIDPASPYACALDKELRTRNNAKAAAEFEKHSTENLVRIKNMSDSELNMAHMVCEKSGFHEGATGQTPHIQNIHQEWLRRSVIAQRKMESLAIDEEQKQEQEQASDEPKNWFMSLLGKRR